MAAWIVGPLSPSDGRDDDPDRDVGDGHAAAPVAAGGEVGDAVAALVAVVDEPAVASRPRRTGAAARPPRRPRRRRSRRQDRATAAGRGRLIARPPASGRAVGACSRLFSGFV